MNPNMIVLAGGLAILLYLVMDQVMEKHRQEMLTKQADTAATMMADKIMGDAGEAGAKAAGPQVGVDRSGSDWFGTGSLHGKGARSVGVHSPYGKDGDRKDSYGQYKFRDEIYPDYYNKTEVYTSDYFPWWRNSHYWPYYTRSHNWQYRYPYYSYWRQPYYYNYWSSPYYPSKTVLIKPYVNDKMLKKQLRHKLVDNFKKAKFTT